MFLSVLWVNTPKGDTGNNLYHFTFEKGFDSSLDEMVDNCKKASSSRTQTAINPASSHVRAYLDISCEPGKETRDGLKKALNQFRQDNIVSKTYDNPSKTFLEIDGVSYYILFTVNLKYGAPETRKRVFHGLYKTLTEYLDELKPIQPSMV